MSVCVAHSPNEERSNDDGEKQRESSIYRFTHHFFFTRSMLPIAGRFDLFSFLFRIFVSRFVYFSLLVVIFLSFFRNNLLHTHTPTKSVYVRICGDRLEWIMGEWVNNKKKFRQAYWLNIVRSAGVEHQSLPNAHKFHKIILRSDDEQTNSRLSDIARLQLLLPPPPPPSLFVCFTVTICCVRYLYFFFLFPSIFIHSFFASFTSDSIKNWN